MNFKVLQKQHQKVKQKIINKLIIFSFLFIVDTNELQRTLNEIKGRVNSAQTDLDNAKNSTADALSGDLFAEAMEVI